MKLIRPSDLRVSIGQRRFRRCNPEVSTPAPTPARLNWAAPLQTLQQAYLFPETHLGQVSIGQRRFRRCNWSPPSPSPGQRSSQLGSAASDAATTVLSRNCCRIALSQLGSAASDAATRPVRKLTLLSTRSQLGSAASDAATPSPASPSPPTLPVSIGQRRFRRCNTPEVTV